MKKILVIQYSQTGQLGNIVRRIIEPLSYDHNIEIDIETIKPVTDYPFPWPFLQFFDTFPEAVYLDPPAIEPLSIPAEKRYDLVLIAYQVWFLSPSLPITAFLKSDTAARILRDTPVVTVIACRDMWLMAQEQVKLLLNNCQAKLIGNIALVDSAGSAGSFLATPLWVLTGNKGPRLGGLIPKAGVSNQDIDNAIRFGERIQQRIHQNQLDNSLLQGLGAVKVNEKLIASEKTARRSFKIWGGLLRMAGRQGSWTRIPILLIYILFLVSFIILFIPISVLLKSITNRFRHEKVLAQKAYFEQPSGSTVNPDQ